jgi:hypothetical protein
MPLILLLIRPTNQNLFCQTGVQKCSQQLFFGLRLVRRIFEKTLTSLNPNQNSAILWRIFSSNKSAPANRRKGFYTNRDPNKQEVGGFLYLAAQNFEIFSNFQDQN